MNGNSNSVPGAIIPSQEEIALPLTDRLASLWQRNAGGVREQFPNREAFLRRFRASEGSN